MGHFSRYVTKHSHPKFFIAGTNELKSFPCNTAGQMIKILKRFHLNAKVSFTIQSHHQPGETYLIKGMNAGWDSEKTGEFPIDLIPEDEASSD